MKKIFGGLFVLLCALSLFACDFSSQEQFGYFTHDGYALSKFAGDSISFDEMISIVTANSPFVDLTSTSSNTTNTNPPVSRTTSFGQVLTENQMKEMMKMYSSVTIETKYFEADNSQVTRENIVYLTTYEQDGVTYYPEILKNNQNTLATGMVINNMILTPELIVYYEQINQDFIDKDGQVDAPFKNMYDYDKYHEDYKLPVLTVSDYSTNNSSITGTSTMEIHQTESVYNDKNLIIKYQASFGFTYATPGSTAYVGTVLEVSFTWNEMK